jgi:hypothetical protein
MYSRTRLTALLLDGAPAELRVRIVQDDRVIYDDVLAPLRDGQQIAAGNYCTKYTLPLRIDHSGGRP